MTSVISAEVMLSLYPIIVKSIDTNIFTQVLIRAITYAGASMFFVTMPISNILSNPSYIIISILNLIHIFSSYVAFKNMNAGVAMTLFYTYPLFNLVFKSILSRSKIDRKVIQYIVISLIGVAFISLQNIMYGKETNLYLIGLIAILIAALTESLIYTFYKMESKKNPFDNIFILYAFGSILMLIFSPKFTQITNQTENIIKLFVFNLVIGLVGHIFRFYGIPRVSTETYSINVFVGVISAYLFGWIFLGETITIYHIIGTLLIAFSVFQISRYYS